MKKLIIGILVIVLSFGAVGCGKEKEEVMDGVFRYANWGDSAETIIELEGDNYDYTDNSVVMYSNAAFVGYSVDVVYLFGEDGFDGGIYELAEKHENKDGYIEDFNSVNAFLRNKYGVPTIDDSKTSYDVVWHTENVWISHSLEGEFPEVLHMVYYMPPKSN